MIWVLDPQKYADAAVHRRFLVPLAGHSEVVAVVLNQADLLTAAQIEDCVQDLRRLLDSEGLPDVQIFVTSARTGAGIEELRKLVVEAVSARKAAAARIAADVDKVVAQFEPYGVVEGADPSCRPRQMPPCLVRTGPVPIRPVPIPLTPTMPGDDGVLALPDGTERELATSFAGAAGVAAIGDALRSARELRAMDYVGWPVSWLIERLTSRDPIRKIRLGKIWDELRGITAGPSGAQQAEIDNALTQVADERVPPLPRPWSRTVRAAIRSSADDIPAALGAEIGAALPAEAVIDRWWRLIGVVQGLLLGCVLVGAAWFVAVLVIGVAGVGSGMPRLFTSSWYLLWASGMVVVGLLGGWLTARLCTEAVSNAASRDTESLREDIDRRMAAVAHDLVVEPADFELAELARFRAELRIAAGEVRRSSGALWVGLITRRILASSMPP